MQLKITFSILCVCLLSFTQVNADTYVAVQNGNYGDSSTWGGTTRPPTIFSGDTVIIPAGKTVVLNSFLSMQNANDFIYVSPMARLLSSFGGEIYIANARLYNGGSIDIIKMRVLGNVLTSTPGALITVKTLELNNATLQNVALLSVEEKLLLQQNNTVAIGSQIKLSPINDTTVLERNGGTLVTSGGGIVDLNSAYSVYYTGSSMSTGLELNGSGLKNIVIDVDTGSGVVSMTKHLTVQHLLKIKSGELALNGFDLTLNITSSFEDSKWGTITSSPFSNIVLQGQSIDSPIYFTDNANIVDSFHVDLNGADIKATLGSDMIVRSHLLLNRGKLHTGDNEVYLIPAAKLTGGSRESYITSDWHGRLSLNIPANDTVFYPVGKGDDYAPVSIASNGISYSGFGMNVQDGIYKYGNMLPNLADTEPVVNATWYIKYDGGAQVDVMTQVYWDSAMEVNGFNRNRSYITTYDDTGWGLTYYYIADTALNGMYTQKRMSVTNRQFTVFDENTGLSIDDVNDYKLAIYPNPATDILVVNDAGTGSNLRISNITGQVFISEVVNDEKQHIDISSLPAGNYIITIYGETNVRNQHFVKL